MGAIRKRGIVFLFLFPSLVFLIIFTYYPVLDALWLSFTRFDAFTPKPIFQGIKNYLEFFRNPIFWHVVSNNVIFGAATIFLTMFLALFFAILINEITKLKTVFKMSLFYTFLVPYAASAMVWVFLYDPALGPIDRLLRLVGIHTIAWLGDRRYSLWAIIIMTIWVSIGYYMIIFLAGLQNIPKSLYEAAKIEGAGWYKRHYYVTLPLVMPAMLFVFIISIIQSFKVFTQIYLMTGGGPGYSSSVLIYYTYEYGFKFWEIGKASALTSIMVLVLLFLVPMIFRVFRGRITYTYD